MSYHIDYRPKNFQDMVGNEIIIESIENVLSKKDHPHSYLFSGNSGCGKTTFARIIANKLGCEKTSIYEINSSNNRGIDTARDIITSMIVKPLIGDIKVYILDEIHMTSKDFQNAMLKPLEDTPRHVYFILCTTNPEKIINPLKKRCVQYEVENIDIRSIVKFLKKISDDVGKQSPVPLLKSIAINSNGSMRDALILLEKVHDIKDEEKAIKFIENKEYEQQEIIDLCRALLNSGWVEVSKILKNLQDDPEKIRRAVLGYMSNVLLNGNNMKAGLIMDCFKNNFYDTGKAGLILACYEIFS